MPYPLSPFPDSLNALQLLLHEDLTDNLKEYFQNIFQWICTTPKISSYRVNTLKFDSDEIIQLIREELEKFVDERWGVSPKTYKHELLPTTILLHQVDDSIFNNLEGQSEVIVDCQCAAAVLRGAHIYAPGIMGMISGTSINDKVRIYADISGKCKKGLQKEYLCSGKVYIGIGIVKMIRRQLFGENLCPRGVAVEVITTISGCPNLGSSFLPNGSAILQNIPSIVCVHVLDPQPGETVLDMCAAPGNKTTHIAALMQNKGNLVAIDKTPMKLKLLEKICYESNAKVTTLQADSTKLLHNKIYPDETFDRILLDAPCSALGQRPQFINKITDKILHSYPPLQRKLFSNAVPLLKVNGRLVYSTCTITLSENEHIVAWALKTFPCLELIKVQPVIGSAGLPCPELSDHQLQCLQRFGPEQDYIGFFIAVFVKKEKI